MPDSRLQDNESRFDPVKVAKEKAAKDSIARARRATGIYNPRKGLPPVKRSATKQKPGQKATASDNFMAKRAEEKVQ